MDLLPGERSSYPRPFGGCHQHNGFTMTVAFNTSLLVSARTHQGLTRSENQDAAYTDAHKGFIAVADGLGGHQSGKLCAQLTTAFFEQALQTLRPSSTEDLFDVMKQCNDALIQHQKDNPKVKGMRTTLVCAQITASNRLLYGWAGDSRLYLYDAKDGLLQLTRDHTLQESKFDSGLKPAEGDQHILTKSLGGNQVFEPVCGTVQLSPNQIIVFSTDGLTGLVDGPAIEGVLNNNLGNLDLAAEALIDCALKAGGADNVTVVLAQLAPR